MTTNAGETNCNVQHGKVRNVAFTHHAVNTETLAMAANAPLCHCYWGFSSVGEGIIMLVPSFSRYCRSVGVDV